ncbi:MAG: Hpt domain-containing protein [Magnetospirillum sp. WYHS-4]
MADDENEVSVIRPPDTLKSKVREGGPGAVDLAALERAEAVIANLTDSYLQWVQEDLVKIQTAYDALAAAPEAERKAAADRVFQVAHDIKGQGGSFGYNLMTVIGNSLCRFIEREPDPSPKHVDVIKVHVDSLKLVIAQNLKGDGGPLGEKLLAGLNAVIDKVAAK